MGDVAILTDSTACIPREVVAQYGIRIAPMTYLFEDRTYLDNVNAPPGEFYHLLEQARKAPATSPPSPGVLLEAFRDLAQRARAVLCVTLPARLSSLYQTARVAADTFRRERPDIEVRVVDSGTVAMAQGFVALAAARAARAGEGLEGAVQAAQAVVSRVRLVAVLDTVHYLAKGGRIAWTTAWVASLLSVKPVVEVAQGEVRPMGPVRSRASGIERMLNYMAEHAGQRPVHVGIMHGNVPQEAERLRARVLERFRCVEVLVNELTPVMGMYAGPGALGLAFYPEE